MFFLLLLGRTLLGEGRTLEVEVDNLKLFTIFEVAIITTVSRNKRFVHDDVRIAKNIPFYRQLMMQIARSFFRTDIDT